MREHPDSVARSCRRKTARRLLPLLLAMYVVSYLDRVNASFAALQMKEQLHFTDAVLGQGFGLFYLGYLLLEIPGALLVERWSARKWFARILLTWGVCSAATALVRTPNEFYLARFLLGLAEAGYFPGMIVYCTHWFPNRDRARALSIMLLAVPCSYAAGAAVSAVLLRQQWLGLAGWQWLFIIEGAPAILLGILVPFLLPDRPRNAKWLTPAERDWLEGTLEEERRSTAAAAGPMRLGQALQLRNVWLLALGIFATNIGGVALGFWLAPTIKAFLGKDGADADDSIVLLWTGGVYLCGTAGVVLSGRIADRTGQRKLCCVIAQFATAICLALSTIPGQPWWLVYLWLCLTGFFANSWYTPYWVLPTLALTSAAAAVSIGFINMFAGIPGFVGNEVVGEMKNAGWSPEACLLFLASGFLIGGLLVARVRVKRG